MNADGVDDDEGSKSTLGGTHFEGTKKGNGRVSQSGTKGEAS